VNFLREFSKYHEIVTKLQCPKSDTDISRSFFKYAMVLASSDTGVLPINSVFGNCGSNTMNKLLIAMSDVLQFLHLRELIKQSKNNLN